MTCLGLDAYVSHWLGSRASSIYKIKKLGLLSHRQFQFHSASLRLGCVLPVRCREGFSTKAYEIQWSRLDEY